MVPTRQLLRNLDAFDEWCLRRILHISWRARISKAPFTRYNLLSNRFDNRLYRVYKHSTRLTTGLTKRLYRVYSRLSNRHYNQIDNRLYYVNGV